MTKKIWLAGLGILVLLAAMQLVPIDRSNPPVTAEIQASPAVMAILRRACYDCHSNETVWPGYSRIAPISWLVAFDTWEGREHLNFSTWEAYPAKRKTKLLKEVRETVEEAEMPPWIYLLNHSEAKLSGTELEILRNWTLQSRGE
jgi:hypothetical protein